MVANTRISLPILNTGLQNVIVIFLGLIPYNVLFSRS